MLWFARHQHRDGAIPASPYDGGSLVLFDYNAYWIETLYDLVLATGDRRLAREVWPQLVRLVDGWYPRRLGPAGLLVNDLGPRDYAYVPRRGRTVAYFNAGYVRALRMAARVAEWLGERGRAAAWRGRIAPLAGAFEPAFWDTRAGAFRDATAGGTVHPQDGNVFAILAGLATRSQSHAALRHLSARAKPYGNPFSDSRAWNEDGWGYYADERVYPFIGFFELAARFEAGLDRSALELVRRQWGYMLAHGPRGSGMWETIAPGHVTAADLAGLPASYDHGWSSGAAPALTEYVLGVRAARPGFAQVAIRPRPGGLRWARGVVPTVRGDVRVEWSRRGRTWTLDVRVPAPATLTLPAAGRATLDGKAIPPQRGETTVRIAPGAHTLVVRGT